MSEVLYNSQILRLAANIPHHERLNTPDVTITKVSAICGSKISADYKINNAIIIDYGQAVRACALGQAAAAIFGTHIMGMSVVELANLRDVLKQFLNGDATVVFPGAWQDLRIFEPAIPHRARHGSILLAFEAAADVCHQREQA
jgi:NifU-like protein involved in Fe-S cluster formation